MVNDLDLARAALGSVLYGLGSPEDFEPEDWTLPAHRTIHAAMLQLGGPPSLPLIHHRLLASREPAQFWQPELGRLPEHAVSSVENYQRVVTALRLSRQRREVAHQAEEILRLVSLPADDSDVRAAIADLERISRPRGVRTANHIADGMHEAFTTGVKPNVPLGLTCLHDLKIVAGNLSVIAARPGVGKTAMLGTITLAAAKAGWRVLFLSLEMSALEVRQRLLAGLYNIPMTAVQECSDPRMIHAAEDLARLPIWLEDEKDQRIDLETIEQLVKNFSGEKCVVCIDYLQLITSRKRFDKRYEAIGHVCRELKHMATGFSVPIIVAAQLSRGAEQHAGKPQLSDLRESGEIEQTADKVLLIHRDGRETMLKVAKYRQGPTWTCRATYAGEYCQFEDDAHA